MHPRPRTGILTLPNELLFIIFNDFDQLSLLDLARSCRQLHFCALHLYYARLGFQDPSHLNSITLSTGSFLLPALRISLFPISIGCLRYHFSPNKFHVQVRQLQSLLARLVRIHELTLDFTDVDYWTLTFTVKDEARLFLKNWIQNFEGLIHTALARSCFALNVCGGRVYPAASQSHGIVALDNAVFWRNKPLAISRIISIRRNGLDPYRDALGLSTHKNNDSKTTLARFHIHSPMLLHPIHSFWTLHILNTSPVTDLSFMHLDFPSASWDKLLSCITVPALSSLSLASCNISCLTLTKFLSRHRRVVTLILGDYLPSAEDIPNCRKAAFNRLTALTAPIDYIFQLLSLTGALPHLHLLSVHTSIPSLRDFSIHTGRYTGRPPHYQSISDLITSAVDRGIIPSMTLTLTLGNDNWLDSLIDEGYIGVNHVLHNILHLVVSASPKLLSAKMVTQFPVWLAGFPLLQRVAFVASPESWETTEGTLALIRSIRSRCTTVQAVVLSGVEHSTVT